MLEPDLATYDTTTFAAELERAAENRVVGSRCLFENEVIHDLENVGATTVRFTTVELL